MICVHACRFFRLAIHRYAIRSRMCESGREAEMWRDTFFAWLRFFLLLDCLDTDEKVPTAKKAEDPSNSDHLPPTCYYGSRLQKPQEVHELLQNEPYKLSDGLLAPAAGRHSAFVVVGLKVRYLKCLVLGMGLRLRNRCRAWGISAGTSVL